MNDERTEIKLWNYIFQNCRTKYDDNQRAFMAYIIMKGGVCYQYELDEHSACVKLADSLSADLDIIKWFKTVRKT